MTASATKSTVSGDRAKVQAALAALTLCHAQAPSTPDTRGYIPGYTWSRNFDQERHYEMVSPEASGLTASELEDLFAADSKINYRPKFKHHSFAGDEKDLMGGMCPLYAENLESAEYFKLAKGISTTPRSANYMLIATNQKGTIVGYVSFTISLGSAGDEDDIWEGEPCDDEGEPGDESSRTVYVFLELNRIYTRARYRGKGAGDAMSTAMGYAYKAEIEHIASQLAPLALELGVQFPVQTEVMSDWESHTGKMAHYMLMDKLTCERDALLFDDTPSEQLEGNVLNCLELLEIDEDAGY